ncbi:Hint domain-containing protein [Roseovarius sp. LXJ103]|uniref:Hint domain-containing protein n=1 Tax=Roseovarius carneus TaxID=2853164 RepID=UPI000D60540B|nr:Hint domain-containing protein [Roseovarius carneus]MBZ8119419.1 Hint domain-containing protein [Roseovarius carneus]PWE34939.1 hypothetical protein DD563_02475 [Pelagicola sp. LXJ1103]
MARVADYEFTGRNGSTAVTDSGDGAHNGTMQGDARLDGNGNATFDGSGYYAVIAADDSFAFSEGTVIIEFTQDTASQSNTPWGSNAAQTLFSVDGTKTLGGDHMTIFIRSDGTVGVRHQSENGETNLAGGQIILGQPMNLGYSWGPQGSTLVLNGTTIARSSTPRELAGGDHPIIIGESQAQSIPGTADNPRGFFDGTISRVQIHDRALCTDTPVPCFAAGTMIAVPGGERAIECLRPGDLVLMADHGPQPLVDATHTTCSAADLAAKPGLRPIRIAPGVCNNKRALIVSRQHAIWMAREDVLIRAIHLARYAGGGVRIMNGCRKIDYHHLLFERHQIIFANGVAAESLLPEWVSHTGSASTHATPVRPILSSRAARGLLTLGAQNRKAGPALPISKLATAAGPT